MKFLKITQSRSINGAMQKHRDTIHTLGLRRIRQTVYHTDTPQIRGMIAAVNYMVAWELVDQKPKAEKKIKKKGYKVVKAKHA